jgi:hypothetical protein
MSVHCCLLGVHKNKEDDNDELSLIVIFFGCIETKEDDNEFSACCRLF